MPTRIQKPNTLTEEEMVLFPEDLPLTIPIIPDWGQHHSSADLSAEERARIIREAHLTPQARASALPDCLRFLP